METIFNHIGLILAIAIPVLLFIIIMAAGYVKAPPDKAIIISGIRKEPRVLCGKAGIKIPFFERKDELTLSQVSINVDTEAYIPTQDFINIKVDAVVKVQVDTEHPENMKRAMRNFLNRTPEQIIKELQDTLQGNMREIIGTMELKAICNDREKFGNQVQEKAAQDMSKLGMVIIACNIQNISDKSGLIEDMGMDNTSRIKKDAAIAKAQSDRDIAIAQAEADKEANEAKVLAETEIAEKNNELEIKKAELKIISDQKKAQADASYDIQAAEQRKTIEVNNVNADIAKEDRAVELKRKEAEVAEQALSAKIKKQADAERYASEQKAEVELFQKKKDAEARRYEQEQEAEALKKKAEADKYAAEQKAEGIRLIGEAEAEAIRAKGIAEAEGIDKKAEAMKKMGEASVLEMFFNAYPEIMQAAAKPLENVSNITMYGEGNSAKLVGDIVNTTTKVAAGIKESTGIDIQAIISGFLGAKLTESEAKNSDIINTESKNIETVKDFEDSDVNPNEND